MPISFSRRRALRYFGSAAIIGVSGCVGGPPEPTPWYGVGAATVESPPEEGPVVSASEASLSDLDHVQRVIEEALQKGHAEVETTEDAYRQSEEVFRELPHLLVVGNARLGESPEFVTPEDSILPDDLREHELLPVIFVESEDSIVSVWPLQYELA